jgi:hypothetical protein
MISSSLKKILLSCLVYGLSTSPIYAEGIATSGPGAFNAVTLNGFTFASPGSIGAGTPATSISSSIYNIGGTFPVINWNGTRGAWQTAIDIGASQTLSDFVLADKCYGNSALNDCSSVTDQIYDSNNQFGVLTVASIVTPGSSYTVGCLITLTSVGWYVHPVLKVDTLSGSGVLTAEVYSLGGYGRGPATLGGGTITEASNNCGGNGAASFTVTSGQNLPTLAIGEAVQGAIIPNFGTYQLTVAQNSLQQGIGGLQIQTFGGAYYPFAITTTGGGAPESYFDTSGRLFAANYGGGATGSCTSPAETALAIPLFNNSSSSYGGIGVDTSGDIYFINATSGTPPCNVVFYTDGSVAIGSTSFFGAQGLGGLGVEGSLKVYGQALFNLLTAGLPVYSDSSGNIKQLKTQATYSGCSNSTPTGGATSGTIKSGTTGTCTIVITLNGATGWTAPTGWNVLVKDETTLTDNVIETASNATTVTISGTTVSGDVLRWIASPF